MEWLKEHPEPETITIHPLALVELAERAQARATAIKETISLSPLVQPGCINAGFDVEGVYHDPQLDGLRLDIESKHNRQHAPSWKRMAALYAFYLVLICGTAWAITHWSPSIEVLCAVLVFAVVACFIVHRNTGGCA